jgi:outer membrane receptor for ferrienterochelin and colicin
MSKNIINITRLLTLAAFCLIFTAGQAFGQAQAGTGQITGIVSDATGAIVPNATVTLTSKATNQTQSLNTSDEGVYRFVSLQPGNYTVKATASNFGEQTLDVEVQVGRTTDANFALGAAGTSAEVTVTAEGIQTTAIQSDAVISQTQIDNLPINGRRFQDFATLTPTVQIDPDRGQISIAGQRGINSNVSVDGTDYNQPFFGGIRGGERSNFGFTIPQEAIREFQVVSGGYSPEFGRSSGGVVNVVTKTGTNDFRGSAFYLLRPQSLSRKSEFVKEVERQTNVNLAAVNRQPIEFQAAPTQQQFGGSFGGPIIKDKLFFFAAYEQQIFRADRQALFTGLDVITAGATNQEAINFFRNQEDDFQITNDVNALFGSILYNINENNSLTARYNFSRNIGENFITTGSSLGLISPFVANALSNEGTEKNRINAFVGQLRSSFSPSLYNEFRFQYSREDRPREANELIPRLNIGNVGEVGTRSFFPSEQYDTRLQFTNNLTYIAGDHTIKVGGEFSRLYANQIFGFNQFGAYTFGVNGNAGLEILSLTPGSTTDRRLDTTNSFFAQQVGNLQAAFSVYEAAFYVNDSWRVTPRFTLDFGVRLDKQYNPSPELGNTTLINAVQNTRFPILNNQGFDPTQIPDSELQVGPRVGFAWDVEGNGKSVVRGFGGVFFARTPLLIFAGAVNNFRTTPGDVSINLGSNIIPANFNLTNFLANNPNYVAALQATGSNCTTTPTSCTPNTVYRQFLLAGINLNNVSLNSLPTLTQAQINSIGTALGLSNVLTGNGQPGIPLGADLQGIASDFENPRAVQFGLGYEREVLRNFVVGIDYLQVNTDRLQRNREINLFAPVPQGVAQRPTFNNAVRPFGVSNPGLPTIRRLFIREATARSFFRSLTIRARYNRSWGQFNAYYTLSRALSDDDNERNATGLFYENTYDLRPEYNLSDLDRKHQFVANPVVFLPFGFEVSSAIRLRSGRPISPVVGNDLNLDTNNNDRPFISPGVPYERNSFRNRPLYDVDLRVQKGFRFDESRRLVLSAEFFNLFNLSNIQIAGQQNQFCSETGAAALAPCGLNGATNVNFLQIREQRQGNVNFGQFITGNNLGSPVFQVQLGARFQF